jgi:hypothetical protein
MVTNYIISAMLPPTTAIETIELTPIKKNEYIGEYEFERFQQKVKVYQKNNDLFCKAFGDKFKLTCISEDRFTASIRDMDNAQLTFNRDQNGNVDRVGIMIGFAYMEFDRIKDTSQG